ncbi:MAG: hypothetical protein ACON5N_13915 [Akkermansiaceae bacterium]
MPKKALLLIPPLVLLAYFAISVFRSSNERHSEPQPEVRSLNPSSQTPSFDWQEIVKELSNHSLSGRIDETSAFGRFMNEINDLGAPELLELRDKIASEDMPEDIRQRLGFQITGSLVRKNPEIALEALSTHLGQTQNQTTSLLLAGFRDWSKKFPIKAEVWLDRQISAGTFGNNSRGGISQTRIRFEREMIRALLSIGEERPVARLQALPESERKNVLRGADTPANRGAYATLVRRFFSPDEQEREFLRMAEAARYQGSDAGLDTLLRQIRANEAERALILQKSQRGSESHPPGR